MKADIGNMNRILVIDEDKSAQEWYSDELIAEGYDVFATGNDSIAMDLMEREKPHLIVIGVPTEEFDAFDLLRSIRNTCSRTPVILSTAYPNSKTGSATDVPGCRLVRGYDLEELKLQVKKAFEARTEIPDNEVLSHRPKSAFVH